MDIQPSPIGVNQLDPGARMPLWQIVNGDDFSLTFKVVAPDGQPATPANSIVKFDLCDTRFSNTPFWTGAWGSGVEVTDQPGVLEVKLPGSMTSTLRRGAYAVSMTCSSKLGRPTRTVMAGTIQVEYEPTSPSHNIPYRHTQLGEPSLLVNPPVNQSDR